MSQSENPAQTAEVQALAAAGLEHHQAGRFDEAEAAYGAGLRLDPDDPTCLYLSGLLAFERGRGKEAAERLQRVADLRPDNLAAQLALAGVRHALGDDVAAADAYRAVVSLDLRNPAVHAALAASLAAAGQAAAAVLAWRGAIDLAPDDASAQVGLALALLQVGDADAAVIAADQALALAPDLADAWFARGRALGDTPQALEAFRRTVALDPDRAGAHLALGLSYVAQMRPDEAEASLLRARTLAPGMAEVHANLGALYILTQRPAEARRSYEAALGVDPDMIEAHQNLAALLADAGEAEASRRHSDLAFARQCLFVEAAPEGRPRVLILVNAGSGNVPFQHLLPKGRFTRISWFIAYAQPGQAAVLPAHDVVFNAIGEPDQSGPTIANVEGFMAVVARPVLNHPGKVAGTARHLTPMLFAGLEDVVAPQAVRVMADGLDARGLAGAVEDAGLGLPVLVRPTGSHGGEGLIRAETPGDLARFAFGPGSAAYLTAYHDYRSADGFYRKYRMIFVDRRPYPYHLAISSHWLVHHVSADMARDQGRIDEERRFLEDPEGAIGARAIAAAAAIGRRLDLDYAGLDFSVLPDGRLLLFEANATMLVHPEPVGGPFEHKNPFVERILGAFQALVERSTPPTARA